MNTDVSSLKSEIKRWEHNFRKQHGRDPTIQEIKDRPDIADKYKLYKKLSKQSSSSSKRNNIVSSVPPSTPPKARREPASSSVLTKSRAVKSEAPQFTTNPFSPVKNKGKQRQWSPEASGSKLPLPGVNPFATPKKSKSRSDVAIRQLSPDPFPPIHPEQPTQSSRPLPAQPLSAASAAVMRARKRLRGEPVSPSPVKEKRARVASQSTIPFAMPSTLLDDSDISDAEGQSHDRRDGPFIEDTPMKPQAAGKAFVQLFQESSAVTQEPTTRPQHRSQSRTQTPSSALFGDSKSKSRALSPDSGEEDAFWKGKISAPKFSSLIGRNPKLQKNGIPHAVLPGKDDLRAIGGQSKPPTANIAPSPALPTSLKRAQTDIELEATSSSMTVRPTPKASTSLLPPSPPPPENARFSSSRYLEKGRGRGGKVGRGKKKSKTLSEHRGDHDSSESSISDNEGSQVKVVDWRARKRNPAGLEGASIPEGVDDVDWGPPRTRLAGNIPLDTEIDPGSIEVSLPEDLKRVLALSPKDNKQKEDTENKVAKELLYGSRIRNYDGVKGGEIWDVGEWEGDEDHVGQEDDWEGEPVPWEVGEL